jgi:hypothetical protein
MIMEQFECGAQIIVVAVLFMMAGMTVPTYYGMERLAGFGRWAVSKLKYRPPPGKDEEEAMEEAVEAGDDG